MAKNIKLSTRQARNVRARHSQLLKEQDSDTDLNENSLGSIKNGTIVSRYGKQTDVEDDDTRIVYRCFIRRTIESLTTGDKVLFRIDEQHNEGNCGLVETVKPRLNLLSRPDFYDGLKPVAANISKILIVSAKEPEFSTNILDRYLIACDQAKIQPVIVINKYELFSTEEQNELENILDVYKKIGYTTLKVSTVTGLGIDELKELIDTETTVLVGQSGVGKTSLLNTLVPKANGDTNIISSTSGLGQHTTTNARLYHLSGGGIIIDSPGVREFSLWHLTAEEVTKSYIEFSDYLGTCKFRDCKHLNDPGCSIIEAVKKGDIAEFRFNNYHRIIESMTQNKPDSYIKPGKKYGK